MQRCRVFVDFWNFQAGWNQHAARSSDGRVQDQCDWTQLPVVLVGKAGELLARMGIDGPFSLEETVVHASIDPTNPADDKLRRWLSDFVDRQPSYNVTIHQRRPRPFSAHCGTCGVDTGACPACGTAFRRSVEKGVDTALVTDLLSLGFERAFDVGVLVSSDSDFVPAVQHLQERGLKVINVAWPESGHELKKACWADIDLARCKQDVTRSPR